MSPPDEKPRWQKILRSPWTCLVGVVLGVLVGLHFDAMAETWLKPFGDLYIAILQMCVLPIIMTAIAVSVGRLLKSGRADRYLLRVVAVFGAGVLLAACVGFLLGALGQPGYTLSPEARRALGKVFLESGAAAEAAACGGEAKGLWSLLDSLVPSNVFYAMSSGESLALVFFSILFGAAVGTMGEAANELITILDRVYQAFFRILNGALLGLPLGLFCLMAGQISSLGTEILVALAHLVLLFVIGCAVLFVLYVITMRLSTGMPILTVLGGIKEALIISLVVSSSVPAIPIALENLRDRLGVDGRVTNFAVPLGVVMNRQGYAMLFALTAVFVAQLYDLELTLSHLAVIVVGSALAGMAAVGAPAVIAPLLGYVLAPLGLPTAVGVAVFVAISPAIDPLLSMINLHASCATTTVIACATPSGDREQTSPSRPAGD